MSYIENTNTKARQTGTNPIMLSDNCSSENEQRMVWLLIWFPNWMTPNGKAKDGIYRRGVFFLCFFMLRMKNKNRDNVSNLYIPFSVFELGKKKRNLITPFPFSILNRRMKNESTVYTTHGAFPFFVFKSCKRKKNKDMYNRSYFYLSFFVWWLGGRQRMLICLFSIFYYDIEKRKSKERYIHGIFRRLWIQYGIDLHSLGQQCVMMQTK